MIAKLMLATQYHQDARYDCVQRVFKMHGESYYGAHRLPAGKTAAKGR
jgi:hypothetical protein